MVQLEVVPVLLVAFQTHCQGCWTNLPLAFALALALALSLAHAPLEMWLDAMETMEVVMDAMEPCSDFPCSFDPACAIAWMHHFQSLNQL